MHVPVGAPGLIDLFGSMHAGVYATDAGGRVTMINGEALRLLGREGEDLVGQVIHDLAHDRDPDGELLPAEQCQILSVIRTDAPARRDEDMFWRADGTALPVSWIAAPLRGPEGPSGLVVVFADATARQVETERGRIREAEAARLAEANEQLEFLGRVSDAVAILDLDEGLRRLGRLTVARLADACVLHAVEDGTVRRVAVAQREGGQWEGGQKEGGAAGQQAGSEGDAATPNSSYPGPMPLTSQSSGALAQALASGVQQGVGCTREESGDALADELAWVFRETGGVHALVTPLTARHQVLGAMSWVRLDKDNPFTEADEQLAADVARRAGLVLDNARMYGQQRRAAETIQRSLLTVLPQPDHLQATARYLPATEGAEVGGDWYDAFVLPDGATSIVIGDILGHDLTAASHMSQVRNVLRGIAFDRQDPPSLIMTRLDQAMAGLGVDALATCLLARLEQDEEHRQAGLRLLRWTNAGHLPPALVSADGAVTLLDRPADLMLGVYPGTDRADHTVEIEPGSTIWLYTDGLVERSDQPLDQGLARLRQALAAVASLPLEQACDQLLARLLPGSHPDDVALLAIRAHPEDQPRPPEAWSGQTAPG